MTDRPRKTMNVTVNPLSHGGVRIYVGDEETDTLAIFEVRSDGDFEDGALMATTKLRGNTDVHKRPVQKTNCFIDAPRVSSDDLRQRRRDYMARNQWRTLT